MGGEECGQDGVWIGGGGVGIGVVGGSGGVCIGGGVVGVDVAVGSGVGGSGVGVGIVHGVESGGGVFGWCWLERVFMLVFMRGCV